MRIRRALFSLTDKRGAAEFAGALASRGVEILSTGNTARVLREAGIEVTDVAEFTGFPEILGGRVKTLHPRVHGGLLARRDDASHQAQMQEHGLVPIDLVAVNLYAFEKVTRDAGATLDHAIENIDIGGPSMIRSAAKNHHDVAVVVDPDDYAGVLAELAAGDLELSAATARRLALKAFQRTAAYDAAIAAFLGGRVEFGAEPGAPGLAFLRPGPGRQLRYGENPHQRAAFHSLLSSSGPAAATARQLAGKELSYNNILDSDAAVQLVLEFGAAACVVVKHTNPCGAALADDVATAFTRALAGDPVSAFGGIVAFNRPVDGPLASAIAAAGTFFECILAPEFSEEAVAVITGGPKWGKNVRLLAYGSGALGAQEHEVRKVRGGLLVQTRDDRGADDPFDVRSRAPLDPAQVPTLRFAWLVAKHVKSNAIVLARDRQLVGVGAGQMSRVDAVALAVRKAGERSRGAVLASDAFFPFRDGVDEAVRAGVGVIVQPGGSVRDPEVIAAADESGVVMVLTGTRHFRH